MAGVQDVPGPHVAGDPRHRETDHRTADRPTSDRFSEGSLSQRWQDVVARRGGRIAAADDHGSLTYEQLDQQSAALADRIRAVRGKRPDLTDEPVAVLIGHDRLAAVAMLACLRLGVPRLNLDPTMPVARLRQIVAGSGARIGAVVPEHASIGHELGLDAVVEVDAAVPGATGPVVPGQRLPWYGDDLDAPMSITYTSGSTGAPKGVAVRFRTTPAEVARRTAADWLREDDVVGVVMPLTFGAAQGEVTATLFVGASLQFFDPRTSGAGPLVGWLQQQEVTVLAAPPSLLTALVRAAGDELQRTSLRSVRSSGEKVLCSEALAIKKALPPSCRLLNVFGSSEATLISSYEITDETPDLPRPVPVGRPLDGIELRLEREDGTEPPPGESGELLVVSRVLPLGYWRDEVRTRQRYTDLDDGRVLLRTGDLGARLPNGMYRLAGRQDLSVKIRGNLVEPAEVEVALLSCTGVDEAVVVGRPGRNGHDRLVAYVVPKRVTRVVRATALRRELRTVLPTYMIPESVVFLRELPRTDRGKLDRLALPEPPQRDAAEVVAPRTEWEAGIAAIWAGALELDAVGVDDDFFDLGGDSLAAEEIIARLSAEVGVTTTSRLLIDAPTLGEFAQALAQPEDRRRSDGDPSLVPLRVTGSRPPLFCVAGSGILGLTYLPLARHLDAEQPVWALQARWREGRGRPEWSVRRLARRYIRAMRTVAPEGPYLLAGHSFGAVVAFEMAHQLRAAGIEVALLASLDSFAPHPSAMPRMRRRSVRQWARAAGSLLQLSTGRPQQSGGAAPTEGRAAPVPTQYSRQTHAVSLLYRGKPYAGRALVVSAADQPGKALRGAPWGRFLTGRWELREVPGAHATMLRAPHVPVLAATLDAAIVDALAASPS